LKKCIENALVFGDVKKFDYFFLLHAILEKIFLFFENNYFFIWEEKSCIQCFLKAF